MKYFRRTQGYFGTGLVLVLLATGSLAACGEEDQSDASVQSFPIEAGQLSKPEFIKRADRICEASVQKLELEYATFVRSAPAGNPSAELKALGKAVNTIILPNMERNAREIAKLGAPRGDVEQVARFLDSIQARLEVLKAKPEELTKTVYPFPEPSRLARKYGLQGCANSLL